MAQQTVMSPIDLLRFQQELVRTGQYEMLGRANKIAIGPSKDYTPPPGDKYIEKFGRLMELRDRFLPIAESPDRTMILATAPLADRNGNVGLPDVPDPEWTPPARTREEITGVVDVEATAARRKIDANAGEVMMPAPFDPKKYDPRMIPQRLEDRTSISLEGTGDRILVFQPVLYIAFQPEIEGRTRGTAWLVKFSFNPVDRTFATMLVDRRTGQVNFYGGMFDIETPAGE